MNVNRKLNRLKELLIYIVLVAAFGFVATLINQNREVDQNEHKKLISTTPEPEFKIMKSQGQATVDL